MWRIRTDITGLQGAPYLSTHFFNAGGGSAQQAADAVSAFWLGCASAMANELTMRVQQEVADIEAATGALNGIISVTTGANVGANTTEILPFACQGLIRWSTTEVENNRLVKGRTFIPGLTQDANQEGVLTGAALIDLDAAADALVADANSELVIWHRPKAGALGTQATVTAASVWTQFAMLTGRRD